MREKIALAQSEGSLSLALRNPLDVDQTKTNGVKLVHADAWRRGAGARGQSGDAQGSAPAAAGRAGASCRTAACTAVDLSRRGDSRRQSAPKRL